jgi:hypothetical protein
MALGARDWRHQFSRRQRGGAAEAWEPRWGGGTAAAQAANPVRPRSEYVTGRMARPWLAAAGLVVKGSPGACHTRGETGHPGEQLPSPLAQRLGREQAAGAGKNGWRRGVRGLFRMRAAGSSGCTVLQEGSAPSSSSGHGGPRGRRHWVGGRRGIQSVPRMAGNGSGVRN